MNSRSVLHRLARAFKAPVSRLQHPSTLRLSWNSTWCVCPASDTSRARPLPVTVADDLRPAVYQTTSHGPPSWFLTTSTVSSARSIRVYCNPSRTRFATFQVPWSRPFQMHAVRRISLHTSETAGLATPFYRSPAHPRNAVHTLRRIPLVSSRTASLRPLPSCCFRGSLHHSHTWLGVLVLPRPKSVPCPVRGLPHSRRPYRRSGRASLRRAMAIELDARCPSYPLRPAPKRDGSRSRFEAQPQSSLLAVTSGPRPLARPEGRARCLDTHSSLKLQDPHLAVALSQPIANGLTCARPNRQADSGQLMTLASSPRGDSDRRQRAPACLRLREP